MRMNYFQHFTCHKCHICGEEIELKLQMESIIKSLTCMINGIVPYYKNKNS